MGETGDNGQKEEISSYKINNFWGCNNVQYSDCN